MLISVDGDLVPDVFVVMFDSMLKHIQTCIKHSQTDDGFLKVLFHLVISCYILFPNDSGCYPLFLISANNQQKIKLPWVRPYVLNVNKKSFVNICKIL